DDYLDVVIQCPTGSSPSPALRGDDTSYLFRVHKQDRSYWSPGPITYFNVESESHYLSRTAPEHLFLRFSDIHIKEDITPLTTSLDEMLKIESYQYRYVDQEQFEAGFLAQQVEEVYPALVFTDIETGNKLLDYKGMIPILLESIRELNEKVEQLELRLESQ
ncbi:hypothetical protein C1141_20285, partial [Vibrio agarivorans]